MCIYKMITYMFPGQGSQKKGMGIELFDEFHDLVDVADSILGYSIKDFCLEDKDNLLGQTQYTQPILFVVNALSYLHKIKNEGKLPDYLMGHSLGEYNALHAAGVFDFSTGVKITRRRGELMAAAVEGGMAAVLGLSADEVQTILKESNLESLSMANLNSPTQIVISGKKEDIICAQTYFNEAGAFNYVVLDVSGAFHSKYMEEAGRIFKDYISQFTFASPQIPVVSNTYARTYDEKSIADIMVKQMVSPVRWEESIRYLISMGDMEFEQVGPGKVVINLVRAIKRNLGGATA